MYTFIKHEYCMLINIFNSLAVGHNKNSFLATKENYFMLFVCVMKYATSVYNPMPKLSPA